MRTTAPSTNYECPLLPRNFYHVFNRTNNKELLFRSDENRRFFLEKFQTYLLPYLEVHAFCLLGNHFHALVRIRTADELEKHLLALSLPKRSSVQKKVLKKAASQRAWEEVLSHQFQLFFGCYAMAVNEQWKRKGNLFQRPFKRVLVKDENHLVRLIFYIHANPKKHGLMADFRNYDWSSYRAMLSDSPTKLERQAVLDWFGGKAAFEAYHQQMEDWKDLWGLIIE